MKHGTYQVTMAGYPDQWGTGVSLLETYYRDDTSARFGPREVSLHREHPTGLGSRYVYARGDTFPGPLTPLKLRLSHASWTCEMDALPLFRDIAFVDWLRFSDPVWTTGLRLWERTNVY